jgi:hypothetical protein
MSSEVCFVRSQISYVCINFCFTLNRSATYIHKIIKLASIEGIIVEQKHLFGFPGSKVQWHQLTTLSMQDAHPLANQMKMWHESRNLFIKTDTSQLTTCLMRWESHVHHDKTMRLKI